MPEANDDHNRENGNVTSSKTNPSWTYMQTKEYITSAGICHTWDRNRTIPINIQKDTIHRPSPFPTENMKYQNKSSWT
jgi:hypothetical protein